jgi:hypothetical protein
MARPPKPWWWKKRKVWCVYFNGTKHILGSDRQEAVRRFHAMMAQQPAAPPPPPAGDSTAARSTTVALCGKEDLALDIARGAAACGGNDDQPVLGALSGPAACLDDESNADVEQVATTLSLAAWTSSSRS